MKKNKIIVGFFLISIILLILFYKLFERKAEDKLVVVNVLDKELFDDAHIKGSINIPFDDLALTEYAKKINKDTHVVFYCSNYMCTASGEAAKLFKKLGFKNVWAYEAGMAEWYQEKLPTNGMQAQAYLNMKVAKPEASNGEVQHITTQELKDKIKKMLTIEGF